jgi:hypothetical protein
LASTQDLGAVRFIIRDFGIIVASIGSFYPLLPFLLLAIYLIYRNRDVVLLF